VLELARLFRERLTALVAHWIRVGYCQGNFNSDNCAAGGFTLDYGPFGFCELFDPRFQPWTGGGEHFCFFNQPAAAEANYGMLMSALRPLLEGDAEALAALEGLLDGFRDAMGNALEAMWAAKLGLNGYDAELLNDLLALMLRAKADYTRLFRRLSDLPQSAAELQGCCYAPSSADLDASWQAWLERWQGLRQASAAQLQAVNPAITWREWLIAPAYQRAEQGDTSLIQELQRVFRHPYQPLPPELAATYDRLKPEEFFNAGGVSHYSCSS
jgi:uncharacterized protein YdiU (UPF0061 family)